MKTKERLEKAGWRLISRRKAGCMWIIIWRDPVEGLSVSQGVALLIQRDRDAWDKLNAKKAAKEPK